MRLFVSAGEPSGDLHGSNLIHELRRRAPDVDCFGFGGDRLANSGCRILYPLADTAIIGLAGIASSLPLFFRLKALAEERIKAERPDAMVLIDYPGFHWHLARLGKKLGVPVYNFIAPQIWSWATWRVEKLKRLYDLVLCTLPFEEKWFREQGVANAHYVGHPFFDEIAERSLDESFIARQRSAGPGPVVALLPGSRNSEVHLNGGVLIESAARLIRQIPFVRFLMGAFKESHRERLQKLLVGRDLPIEIHVGKTPEIQRVADVALAVSGSVSLELMHAQVPTVIVYRVTPFFHYVLKPLLLKTPSITLVNLIAGRRLYPEFVTCYDPSEKMARIAGTWLSDERSRQAVRRSLGSLKDRFATPGATRRAAEVILADLASRRSLARAG